MIPIDEIIDEPFYEDYTYVSECCGAVTNMPDIDICPECLEHCEFEKIVDYKRKK